MSNRDTVGSVPDRRSTAELVHDLSAQISTLIRDELRLATTELAAKGKRAGAGAGLLGAAGVLAAYGGLAMVACAVLALSLVVSPWLAALIVAAALLMLAGVVALMGRGQLRRAVPLVPQQAVRGVGKDIETVKEHAHR